MKYLEKNEALLMLADGTIYRGKSAGKKGTATGEICFNTGMSGYQEIFTDPSYFGQIMVMTNVHIGNYGVHKEEVESEKIKISGMVCKSFSNMYSRPQGDSSLGEYFENQNLVVISDIDTRALVRHIRDKGSMNAVISTEVHDLEALRAILDAVPSMEGLELSSKVSTTDAYLMGSPESGHKVAVLDLGVKKNILRSLEQRGCLLKVFPMNTTSEEMKSWKPDGYLISNGPGDPAVMPKIIQTVKEIIEGGQPVFGICLGHQIIAETQGIRTYKMHNGHRGINQPVKNLLTGKSEITSQNHGFGVVEEDVKNNPNVEITHLNLNDNTIEGIRIKDKNVFSVQYHPEASPGPHDSRYLFDDFISMMSNN